MQADTVHKAQIEDAAALAEMAQALAAFEGEPSLANEEAMRKLLANQTEPTCQCLIAKRDDQPIGFVLFYAGYDLSSVSGGFHLADLYVKDAYRGQGVGKQLLQAVAKQAVQEGRAWISLTSLKSNDQAKAFYQAQDFVEVPVRFFALGATAMTHLAEENARQ